MSRRNFNSPVTPVLSPVKSESDINKTILSQLFSKQFLGCLKDELSSRASNVKYTASDYKQALSQLKACKKQIREMRLKIDALSQDNLQLTRRLEEYQSCDPQKRNSRPQPSIIINPPKLTKKLEFSKPISISIIEEPGTSNAKEEEIQQLRQRIQKLEITKSIKDQRLNEMLQKEVRYDSQLKLLKIKSDELEDEVKMLRQTIILQTEDGKGLKDTVNSQRHPGIAISYHFDMDSPKKPDSLFPNHEPSLIASFTNNFQIPEDLTLSKACLKREIEEAKEFNEIDYIISEELPYLNVSDQLLKKRQVESQSIKVQSPPANLNDSIILINLNS